MNVFKKFVSEFRYGPQENDILELIKEQGILKEKDIAYLKQEDGPYKGKSLKEKYEDYKRKNGGRCPFTQDEEGHCKPCEICKLMPKCKLPQHRCLKKEVHKTCECCELHEDAVNKQNEGRDAKDVAEGKNQKCAPHPCGVDYGTECRRMKCTQIFQCDAKDEKMTKILSQFDDTIKKMSDKKDAKER